MFVEHDDPIDGLLQPATADTGMVEKDPKWGYDRVVFTKAEREKLEQFLARALTTAKKDAEPVHRRMIENLKAYEAMDDNNEDLIALPFCKRDAKHIIAWNVTRIWNRKPICTVEPERKGIYEIPVPVGDDLYGTKSLDSEELAQSWENLAEFKLRRKLPFRQILTGVVTDIVTGFGPAWVKVTYAPQERTVRGPSFAPTGIEGIQRRGPIVDKRVKAGEAVQMYHISGLNMFMPADEQDPQTSRWLAERKYLSPLDLQLKIDAQKFNFGRAEQPEEGEIKKLLQGVTREPTVERLAMNEIDLRSASEPSGMHETFEVWLPWEVTIGGEKTILELCVEFHLGAMMLLNSYVLPFRHGKRPYVPFFMWKRPHQFSGSSTVEDARPIQKMATRAMTLELRSAAQAALKAFKIRRGSVTWNWFQKYPEIAPGARIPVDRTDDLTEFQLGSSANSLMGHIGWLSALHDKTVALDDFARGQNVPGRLPSSTYSQAMEAATTQAGLVLDSIREGFGEVFLLYFQTHQQFSEGGASYPGNPVEGVEPGTAYFPSELLEDEFRFIVTATADEMTDGEKEQRSAALHTLLTEDTKGALELLTLIAESPSPAHEQTAKKLLLRQQKALGLVIESSRADKEDFVFTEKEIDQFILAKRIEQAEAAMDNAEAMAQGGMMGPAGAMGGGIPGAPGPGMPTSGMPPQGGPPVG